MIKCLSYFLNENTPSYGSRNIFEIIKSSNMLLGDIANDSKISTTVHMGTHIDMPLHFFKEGQTIKDFSNDFWFFKNILLLEISPKDFVIKDELIERLDSVSNKDLELLIIKTNSGTFRHEERYAKQNFGFHNTLADILRSKFPKLRVLGFDTISVSSFTNREEGRLSHKAFLNPENPILLLEDLNLDEVDNNTNFSNIIVAPMLIENSDGLPCTVFGEINV